MNIDWKFWDPKTGREYGVSTGDSRSAWGTFWRENPTGEPKRKRHSSLELSPEKATAEGRLRRMAEREGWKEWGVDPDQFCAESAQNEVQPVEIITSECADSHKTEVVMATDNEMMDQMYEIGKEDAEAQKQQMDALLGDSRSIGAVLMAGHFSQYSELLKFMLIARVKDQKEYKQMGLTFGEFCESVGERPRRVYERLKELDPMIRQINQDAARSLGFDMARNISRAITAGDAEMGGDGQTVVIDNIPIPIQDTAALSAAVEQLKARQEKDSEKFQKRIKKLERLSDAAGSAEIKALEQERDALIHENKRLATFVPESESGWDDAKLGELQRAVGQLVAIVRQMIATPDEAIENDRQVQGRISGIISTAIGTVGDLQRDFESRFNLYEE